MKSFKELFLNEAKGNKVIDVTATLNKFREEGITFPQKALEYENKKSIEKKLLKWAKENNSEVVYR